MAEKVSIKVPGHLAGFVRPEAAREDKFRVLRDEVGATPQERVILLFFLSYDKDPEIRSTALLAMRGLPLALVAEIVYLPSTHLRILDSLARMHASSPEICTIMLSREDTLPETVTYLKEQLLKFNDIIEAEETSLTDITPAQVDAQAPQTPLAGLIKEGEPPANPLPDSEDEEEEFKSKYQLAQSMGVAGKIKMALTGDKEWRSLLIKDTNKLVNGAVVKNPRITEPEILAISKSVIQNDEILRVICHNKDWIKNYEIKKALVLNHKTPLPVSLRFMSSLSEKDLAAMAKSKNISSVLSNQARRMLDGKKKH